MGRRSILRVAAMVPCLQSRCLVLLALAMVPLLAAGCENVKVPMRYLPSDANEASGMLASPFKVYVEPVEDRRTNRGDQIGQNVEGAKPFPALATEKTVPQFVYDTVVQVFTEDGLPLVTAPAAADRRVQFVLTNFWVQETGTYHAAVGALVTVYAGNGAKLWEGTMSGADSTYGHSRSAENYRQTLSNAMNKGLAALAADKEFVKVMTKRVE